METIRFDSADRFIWEPIADGHMYQAMEPQGWSINQFKLTTCDKPLWHCIYTNNQRFSIGLWAGRERPLDVEQDWMLHEKELSTPDEMDMWTGKAVDRGQLVDYRNKYCNQDEMDKWNEED